jgi:hypothetical protein
MKRLLIPAVSVAVCTGVIVYATTRINQFRHECAALRAALRQASDDVTSRLDASRAESARLQADNQKLRDETRTLLQERDVYLPLARRTFDRGQLMHYYPPPWWVQLLLAPFTPHRL